jgi:hypothetical protein
MAHRANILAVLVCAGLSIGAAMAGEPGLSDTPPAEARIIPYSADLPPCDEPYVLAQIQAEFERRETNYWQSGLVIEGFEQPRETGFRTNGLSYIPRRYCRARAQLNDGHRRLVVYEIGDALGFIGIGYGVTWCVRGPDRNHAFSPACEAAGP